MSGLLDGGIDRGVASLRERPTPRSERYELGQGLRKQVPRSALGDWFWDIDRVLLTLTLLASTLPRMIGYRRAAWATFIFGTALMPMGFGRYGARVANTPRRTELRGGATFGRKPWL